MKRIVWGGGGQGGEGGCWPCSVLGDCFLTRMKNLSLCNDQCWAGQVIVRRCKDFHVAILSDTISVINVKLCMMVPLIELYLFIPLSLTLTMFRGHRSVKQF